MRKNNSNNTGFDDFVMEVKENITSLSNRMDRADKVLKQLTCSHEHINFVSHGLGCVRYQKICRICGKVLKDYYYDKITYLEDLIAYEKQNLENYIESKKEYIKILETKLEMEKTHE